MAERISAWQEQERKFTELLEFPFTQPDGSTCQVNLAAWGAYGDLAFDATTEGQERPDHYMLYWTGEKPFFLQLAHRWQSRRSPDEQIEDIECIKRLLARLEDADAVPTHLGQGTFSEYDVCHDVAEVACYSMFGGSTGDDVRVDTTGGVAHIAVDRDWDGERKRYGFSVQDDQVWQFIGGMVGRSYSPDGATFTQRTRYPTSEYLAVFERLISPR